MPYLTADTMLYWFNFIEISKITYYWLIRSLTRELFHKFVIILTYSFIHPMLRCMLSPWGCFLALCIGRFGKASKCSFWFPEISFLGHVISFHEIAMDPAKIDVIVDWSISMTITKVRGFLGLAYHHYRFMQGLS